jgi:predicted O-methyltransferase YrrM
METLRPSLLEMCRSKQYYTDKSYDPNGVDWNPKILSGAGHCYVENFYEKYFSPKRDSTLNVLEIGVYAGGSTLLWRDYFPNATIFGADINYANQIANQPRIVQVIGNAYEDSILNMFADNLFDIVIDDGSHKLEHMMYFIEKYYTKLKPDGVMVLEDIDNIDWATELYNNIPKHLKKNSKIYDLRSVNRRYDDIAIVINGGFY